MRSWPSGVLGVRAAVVLSAFGAAVSVPAGARADELTGVVLTDEFTGMEGGLRTGYAFPLGRVPSPVVDPLVCFEPGEPNPSPLCGGYANNGIPLSLQVHGAIPFWFDLGIRVDGHFYIGAFVEYGVAIGVDADPVGPQKYDAWQLGGDAIWHFLPRGPWDPWVGATLGWELGTDGSGPLLGPQAGLDHRLGPAIAVGPFMALNFAYLPNDPSEWHGWLSVGLRVTLLDRGANAPAPVVHVTPEWTPISPQ
jgi:hypothetical protein